MQKPKKALGLWMLTALVTGNMIGSGVFLLPSSLAHFGSIGILGWGFTAVGALLLAFVFARLSRMRPGIGGPYAYCHDAFGDFIGFQIAYSYWVALWVGNAAIALAFTGYLSVFVPVLATSHAYTCYTSIGIVWLLTVVNILSIREAGVIQLVTTIIKLLPLILLATVGLFFIHKVNLFTHYNISGESDLTAFSATAALTLWAFIGVESATIPADSVENPKRNIPLATLLGTSIAAVVYILSTISIMGILPNAVLARSIAPFAAAAGHIFGNWGLWLVAIGAVFSCFGALNGWIMLQGQVPMAAARDGLFPPAFAKQTKNETPYVGLIISAILITILLLLNLNANLVNAFQLIILIATFASLVPYLFTTIAEIILLKQANPHFCWKRLGSSVLGSSLAFIYSFWAVIGSGGTIVYYGSLLIFTGIPIYAWLKWHEPATTVTET